MSMRKSVPPTVLVGAFFAAAVARHSKAAACDSINGPADSWTSTHRSTLPGPSGDEE